MNAIYMVAINHNKSQYQHSDFADYSKKTWEYWCEKNGVDFHCVTEHDDKYGYPIWNKLNVTDVCKDYDKVGIVDCDTMIKWDAPNIFDEVTDGVYGVQDVGNLRWIDNSIKTRQHFFNHTMDLEKYINAGVVWLDKKSLSVYKHLQDFYFEHQEELDSWTKGGGKEQTLFNFHLQSLNYKVNVIPPIWNLVSMHKTEMFSHNWQDDDDKTPFFIKYGYVWHFTGFEIEKRYEFMKNTWELTKENYE